MTPSFSHRIDSFIQAMSDIVLPAIESDKSLAREQAQLIIAHLNLIKQQLPLADSFDRLELNLATELGLHLVELCRNDELLTEARLALEVALSAAEHFSNSQDAIRYVNGSIEQLIRTIRIHSGRGLIEAATKSVLAHAKERSLLNRIWFASNGFDSERDALPTIASLFEKG